MGAENLKMGEEEQEVVEEQARELITERKTTDVTLGTHSE